MNLWNQPVYWEDDIHMLCLNGTNKTTMVFRRNYQNFSIYLWNQPNNHQFQRSNFSILDLLNQLVYVSIEAPKQPFGQTSNIFFGIEWNIDLKVWLQICGTKLPTMLVRQTFLKRYWIQTLCSSSIEPT